VVLPPRQAALWDRLSWCLTQPTTTSITRTSKHLALCRQTPRLGARTVRNIRPIACPLAFATLTGIGRKQGCCFGTGAMLSGRGFHVLCRSHKSMPRTDRFSSQRPAWVGSSAPSNDPLSQLLMPCLLSVKAERLLFGKCVRKNHSPHWLLLAHRFHLFNVGGEP
jgi:hypothetical protein